MVDTELKPCPFCGGTDLEVVDLGQEFELQCWSSNNCHATYHIGGKTSFKTVEKARNSETLIKGWNARNE